MSTRNTVTLTLSADQALVFFDWLTRHGESDALPVAHQAEQDVLWVLEGQLEKSMVEPLKADYVALVEAARARMVGRST